GQRGAGEVPRPEAPEPRRPPPASHRAPGRSQARGQPRGAAHSELALGAGRAAVARRAGAAVSQPARTLPPYPVPGLRVRAGVPALRHHVDAAPLAARVDVSLLRSSPGLQPGLPELPRPD